jgi:hypothetical protein
MATTATRPFTLIEPDRTHEIEAVAEGDRVLVAAAAVAAALGWERRPAGLCRGDACRPVREPASLEPAAGLLDLAELAGVLGRPLALDVAAGVAFLSEAPAERAAALRTRLAPDFTLPDLDGRPHRLSDERGKKVFLVFWASW